MRVLDPAQLAAARATANSTLSPGILVQITTTARGDDIGDESTATASRSYRGRMHLVKADETPKGMTFEGREVYVIELPAGAEFSSESTITVGGQAYNVVGADDAPLGGEIQRRAFVERI